MGDTKDGDGSTLTLDFTQGILDSRLTFTRASTATFINSSGLVESASNNVARFDYDPTTLQPRGLLIEGSATNVLLGFAAGSWGRQNIDGSGTGGALANGQTGPDGVANTAARITTAASTTFPVNMFTGLATNAAGNSRTFSVWLRGVGANTTASIAIVGSNTPTGVASSQSGNSVTLATSTSGNNLLALVTGLSTTAWTRVSISRTDTQTSSDSYRICPGNHTGTISSGLAVDVYVPQAESGIGMSSTIPTAASQATRAADDCQLLDLTAIQFNASAGTMFIDMGDRISTGSNRSYTFLPTSGGNNQFFEGSGIAFQVFSGGLFVAQIGTSTSAAQKIASAYSVNDYAVSVKGGAAETDTSGALPTSLTKLTIGGSIINSAAYQFGCIRKFKYWPTRLPDAQLTTLTT